MAWLSVSGKWPKLMCGGGGAGPDNCPVNIYVAVAGMCAAAKRKRWHLPILLTPTKKRKESRRRMRREGLETHVITLRRLSTDGWMDGRTDGPSSRRRRSAMCLIPRYGLQTQLDEGEEENRTSPLVGGSKLLLALQPPPSVCLTLTDADG